MMPTETPHGTRSRVEPSSRANERPSVRSSASRTAISRAPLDIRWPLNGLSASPTPGASTTSRERGDQVAPHDVDGAVDVLGGVQRVAEGDALAPAVGAVGERAHDEHVARGLRAERRPKGRDERHGHPSQLESLQSHATVLRLDDVSLGAVEPDDPSAVARGPCPALRAPACAIRAPAAGCSRRSDSMSAGTATRTQPARVRVDRVRPADHGGAGDLVVEQLPPDQQAIGLVLAVDAVAHDPVEVREVLDRHRRELADVEVGVAGHQRIEGPLDDRDAARDRPRRAGAASSRSRSTAPRPTGRMPAMWLCSALQLGCRVEADGDPDERPRRRRLRRCSRPTCRTRAASRARSAGSRVGPRSRPRSSTAAWCSSRRWSSRSVTPAAAAAALAADVRGSRREPRRRSDRERS